MESDIKKIKEELEFIKSEIYSIKRIINDKEAFLTVREKAILEESYLNEKDKKLISQKNLKKKLGL